MPLSGQDDVALLNDVANALNQQKIENYVIITSLKSDKMDKLINRIPGSRLLISNFTRLGFENAC